MPEHASSLAETGPKIPNLLDYLPVYKKGKKRLHLCGFTSIAFFWAFRLDIGYGKRLPAFMDEKGR
jgi:hypothetical protein